MQISVPPPPHTSSHKEFFFFPPIFNMQSLEALQHHSRTILHVSPSTKQMLLLEANTNNPMQVKNVTAALRFSHSYLK